MRGWWSGDARRLRRGTWLWGFGAHRQPCGGGKTRAQLCPSVTFRFRILLVRVFWSHSGCQGTAALAKVMKHRWLSTTSLLKTGACQVTQVTAGPWLCRTEAQCASGFHCGVAGRASGGRKARGEFQTSPGVCVCVGGGVMVSISSAVT